MTSQPPTGAAPGSLPAVPSRPKPGAKPQLHSGTSPIAAANAAAGVAPAPAATVVDPIRKMYASRHKVAGEVLSSEASYCTSLSALVDVAIVALQPVLTEDENKLLFSNIATLLKFNQKFCADLSKRLSTWSDEACLGDIFTTFTPFLKMYTQYVSNHEAAIEFQSELENQPRFLRIKQDIFGNPRMEGSGLFHYLIMPIQRIPRYSLLLNELIKNTPPDHPDLAPLKVALEQVNQVAARVNADIAAQKNRLLVYRKTLLLGLDEARFVQPSRYFVFQGAMTKVCRSRDILYEFFLFNDVLIYASRVPVGKFKVHQEIPIDLNFALQDVKDDEKRINTFSIINGVKSFAVYCATPEDKAQWISLLTELIHKAKDKIPGKDENGVIVPVWIPDDNANACFLCKCEFSFFNRRHHCRFCGGLVCNGCSKNKATLRGKEERICDSCVKVREQYNAAQGIDVPEPALKVRESPELSRVSDHGAPVPLVPQHLQQFIPQPQTYIAVQTNVEEQDGDLAFAANDKISVYFTQQDGWWIGTNHTGDRCGIFLAELVRPDPSAAAPSPQAAYPKFAALAISDPLEAPDVPTGKKPLQFSRGDLLCIMQEEDSFCLAYNLKNKDIGFISRSAIYDLISEDQASSNVTTTTTALAPPLPPNSPTNAAHGLPPNIPIPDVPGGGPPPLSPQKPGPPPLKK